MSLRRASITGGFISLLALLASACVPVMQTTELSQGLGAHCSSGLGAYKLPKTFLRIQITQDVDLKKPEKIEPYILHSISYVRRADNRFHYCLDYLASPFADDVVQVKKQSKHVGGKPQKSQQLLQVVSSKAVDQSAMIIRKLIRTIFIGLSQNANFTDARTLSQEISGKPDMRRVSIVDVEFDPFDPVEVAALNQRLRKLGFCVVLGDYTFDRRTTNASRYCRSPNRIARAHPSPAADLIAEQQPLKRKQVRGVYYRPRARYSLGIYVKDDPGGTGRWRLAKQQAVQLENVSPVISLGIDRAIFGERRTALVFDDGVLTHVCIAKGSEIEGAIQIPLDVIYGLVALPSQIAMVRIDSTNLQADVIKAEQKAIAAQKALIDYRMKKGSELQVTLPADLNKTYQDPTKQKVKVAGVDEAIFNKRKNATIKPITPPLAASTGLTEICDQKELGIAL